MARSVPEYPLEFEHRHRDAQRSRILWHRWHALSRVDLEKSEDLPLYGGDSETPLSGWFDPYLKPAKTEPHDYLSWPTHSRHYKREVTHLIDAYQKGEPFRSTFDDGLKVVRVTEAAYRSAKERRFVDL